MHVDVHNRMRKKKSQADRERKGSKPNLICCAFSWGVDAFALMACTHNARAPHEQSEYVGAGMKSRHVSDALSELLPAPLPLPHGEVKHRALEPRVLITDE